MFHIILMPPVMSQAVLLSQVRVFYLHFNVFLASLCVQRNNF